LSKNLLKKYDAQIYFSAVLIFAKGEFMQVQKVNNSPEFGAKIIIGDDGVQKFIKSSFMAKGREMHNLLDTFNNIHRDTVVTIGTRTTETGDYLFARNGVTGQTDKCLLGSAEKIDLENRNAFFNFVSKLIKNKNFWSKITDESADMTAIKPVIEHDVFNLK